MYISLITDTLCLQEMDILALRNLRDMTVMFLSRFKDREKPRDPVSDEISAITFVIDRRIYELGGEV